MVSKMDRVLDVPLPDSGAAAFPPGTQPREFQQSRSEIGYGVGHQHAPLADWREIAPTEHFVQFYESDDFLLDTVAEFIGAALRGGDAGIVVATPAHREGIEARLATDGLDLGAARAGGQYVALDAAETLALLMVAGAPDAARFSVVVGGLIAHAAQGGRNVRVFGEMVALLAAEGDHASAVQLEELWNGLQQVRPFALFCAYSLDQFDGGSLAKALGDICAAHSRVIPAEGYSALPTSDGRLREIAVLQQKARWLEAEIAARERAEERLQVALAAEQAARREAEAALRLRDEFLSVAAHELKTPLTGLLGYAQLIQRQFARGGQANPERVRQALGAITGQAERLARLLGQLLDISRLEGGNLTLERQLTDLVALVGQAVSDVRAASERHPITLATPVALEARIDPLRLEQVLTNLLDNARKYSPGGGRIDVTLSRTDQGLAELTVRDYGLGIPPEKRAQIFERFYQAHAEGYGSGWGLGLYISHQIVALHGGEIRAEFPPDGGTRFIVRLPIAAHAPNTIDSLAQIAAGVS
jgi:signal transduction histidine kinase